MKDVVVIGAGKIGATVAGLLAPTGRSGGAEDGCHTVRYPAKNAR